MTKKKKSDKPGPQNEELKKKKFFSRLWTLINENPMPASAIAFVLVAVSVALCAKLIGLNLMVVGLSLLVLAVMGITGIAGAIDTFSLKKLWVVLLCLAAMAVSGYWAWSSLSAVRKEAKEKINNYVQTVIDLAIEGDMTKLKPSIDSEIADSLIRAGKKLKSMDKFEPKMITPNSYRCIITLKDGGRYSMKIENSESAFKVTYFVSLSKPKEKTEKKD